MAGWCYDFNVKCCSVQKTKKSNFDRQKILGESKTLETQVFQMDWKNVTHGWSKTSGEIIQEMLNSIIGLNLYSIHSLLCFTWLTNVGLIPYGSLCLTRVMVMDIFSFKGSESGIYLNLLNCFDYSLSMMWLVKNTLSKFFHFYLICNLFDEEKRISRRSEVLWRQLLPIIIPDICWRK